MNLRYERKAPQAADFAPATKIIWHPSELETYYDRPVNSCCMFRRKITLENTVKQAKVRMFADTRYIFYINGVQVGRGPCRSDPRWQYYDVYDVTHLLSAGENLLAAQVMYYGYGTGQSINRIPAFFLQLDICFEDGSTQQIGTDESWKVKLSEAFNKNAPRVNGCKGCIEIFDNRFAEAFMDMAYDDTGWTEAKSRDVRMSPFWNLKQRPIPNLSEKLAPAKCIVAGGLGKTQKGFDLAHLHWQIKAEIESLNISHMYVLGTEGEFPPVDNDMFSYVVIDFEKIRAGYIALNITGYGGDIVDVVYGEELFDGKICFDGVSYRPISRFILKDGENRLETKFNYEAFRYVMLIFRNHIRKNQLNEVQIRERFYPMDKESVFRTSNEKLQKIWDISLHTLKLCMQDGFLDSPSREQQQWMGDGRFHAIMNYYITGDCRMHEKLLLQIAQSQDMEGMTTSRYPDENHNLPPIASFCLQWINSFGDYYDFTGKTECIETLWNHIISAMRWFSGFENKDGLLVNVPYWQYYDVSKDTDGKLADFFRGGIVSLLNMMYAEAMDTIVKLAEVINDMETERFFRYKCKNLKKMIKNQIWNEEKGAYCDCIVDGIMSQSVSEAANAMAILAVHQADDKRVSLIIKNVFESNTRMAGVFRVSPYFMLPFYRALRKAGRNDIALAETEARYGKMVEQGATSTWEHWELVVPNSACHAWGAAPIVCVAENLLGIDLCAKKGVKAMPASLDIGEVEANIVTPKATFEIRIQDGKVKKNTVLQ